MYKIQVNPGLFDVFQCSKLAGNLKSTGIEFFNLIRTVHSFGDRWIQFSYNVFSGHENHSVILILPVIFILGMTGAKDKA